MKVFAYWCEGVVLSAVAVAGVIGNIVSALILSTKNMRNSFNLVRRGMGNFVSLNEIS